MSEYEKKLVAAQSNADMEIDADEEAYWREVRADSWKRRAFLLGLLLLSLISSSCSAIAIYLSVQVLTR